MPRTRLERALGWRSIAALLSLLMVGAVLVLGWLGVHLVERRTAAAALDAETGRSAAALRTAVARAVEGTLASGAVLGERQWVSALVRGGADAPRRSDDLARQGARELGYDGLLLLDAAGQEIFSWGRLGPERTADQETVVQRALGLQAERPLAGLVALGGAAVPLGVTPLDQDFDLLGTLFLAHPPIPAETFDALVAGEASILQRSGQRLGGTSVSAPLPERAGALVGGVAAATALQDGGGAWMAALDLAPTAGVRPEGALDDLVLAHLLHSSAARAPFLWLKWGALALGVLCMGASLVLLRLRPGQAAVGRLTDSLLRLSRGQSARIEGVELELLGDAGAAFNRLGAAQARRLRMQSLAALGSSADSLRAMRPSSLASEEQQDMARRTGVLSEASPMLGVELRRFANPKIRDRAQEDAARASAQFDALAEISAGLGGELLFAAGLRAVVSFRGPSGVARAALAACRMRKLFAVPDDPYRDAMPPLCVLVEDTLVRGPWSAAGSKLALGPAVQQLQPLLLEAVPGEILMTEAFARRLIEEVPAVESAPARRALLTRAQLRELDAETERALGAWADTHDLDLGGEPRWLGREISIRHLVELAGTLGVHSLARVGASRENAAARGGMGSSSASALLAQPFRAATSDGNWLLKLAPEDTAAHSQAWAQEAERMKALLPAGLRPPSVHAFDGRPAILQRAWRSGASLRAVMQERRLSPIEAAQVTVEVAEELARFHRRHMGHGSLKPENVILDHAGSLSLTDGGLGTGFWLEHRGASHASEVSYAAPEQLEGLGSDLRSDVFSVGLLTYEMLTGRTAFEGADLEALLPAQKEAAASSPKLYCTAMSEGLERVVLRCLARRAGDRYQTADDLLVALAETEEALQIE